MSENKIAPRLPRGMRDILPQQMIRRQYVMGVIQSVFEEFGFEPLQTPAIELQETLMGKYGPDAERLIYQAEHRGGKEKLNLRYDLSVPLCRVVAQYPDQIIKPFKRYQMAPVWRAERPQKGRYREFYQCDADEVGSSSMLADAETLNIIFEILTRLGFKKFVMRINDRKIINGIGEFAGIPEELLSGLYRSIDKLAKIGIDGVRAELREVSLAGIERIRFYLNKSGISKDAIATLSDEELANCDCIGQRLRQLGTEASIVEMLLQELHGLDIKSVLKIPDDVIERLLEFLQIRGNNREIIAQLRVWLSDYPEAQEGITEVEEIITYLEALGIPDDYYQVAPAMVRGLEYYTGPIYETEVEEPKIGSITGGGRFDNLVGMFMDHSYPATGTTIGIERIIDVMEELDMFPTEVGKTVVQVLITQFSSELVIESLKVARDLRKAGLNTEMYFENDPLGDQIRYALNKEIPYVVILGPDELQIGQVTIRNLALKVEKTVARQVVAEQIRSWL